MPISIGHTAALTKYGIRLSNPAASYNPADDFRLQPHSSESWWVDLASIQRAVTADSAVRPEWRNRQQKVWMTAQPGARKEVKTKEFSG